MKPEDVSRPDAIAIETSAGTISIEVPVKGPYVQSPTVRLHPDDLAELARLIARELRRPFGV